MVDETPLPIGDRRWLVWLATRTDVNDTAAANTGNLIQNYLKKVQVWASIAPVGTTTFYDNIDTATEITHRAFIRWRSHVNLFDTLIRQGYDLSGGPTNDIYLIRRIGDWQGRKQFLMLDLRLEGHLFK